MMPSTGQITVSQAHCVNTIGSAPSVNDGLVAGECAQSRYRNGNGHPLRRDRRIQKYYHRDEIMYDD